MSNRLFLASLRDDATGGLVITMREPDAEIAMPRCDCTSSFSPLVSCFRFAIFVLHLHLLLVTRIQQVASRVPSSLGTGRRQEDRHWIHPGSWVCASASGSPPSASRADARPASSPHDHHPERAYVIRSAHEIQKQQATHPVQLEVESTRVAHRLPVVVPPPESRRRGSAVGAA